MWKKCLDLTKGSLFHTIEQKFKVQQQNVIIEIWGKKEVSKS